MRHAACASRWTANALRRGRTPSGGVDDVTAPRAVSPMGLKNVLRQIEADRGNPQHDRSPLWIVADPPWHIDAVGGRSHHQRPATAVMGGPPTRRGHLSSRIRRRAERYSGEVNGRLMVRAQVASGAPWAQTASGALSAFPSFPGSPRGCPPTPRNDGKTDGMIAGREDGHAEVGRGRGVTPSARASVLGGVRSRPRGGGALSARRGPASRHRRGSGIGVHLIRFAVLSLGTQERRRAAVRDGSGLSIQADAAMHAVGRLRCPMGTGRPHPWFS